MSILRYELTRDKYQWILREWREGKDKEGNPKDSYKDSFYPNLEQVANKVMESHIEGRELFRELSEAFNEASSKLAKELVFYANEFEMNNTGFYTHTKEKRND